MKILTFTSLSLVLLCCSINANATEFNFVATDNSKETMICLAAVTDNTKDMIKRLRRLSQRGTALKLRTIINLLECNNQYIGHFAKTYNAHNTFAYLDKYTNRRNKKLESNITINDIAYEQGKEKQETIVVSVASQ